MQYHKHFIDTLLSRTQKNAESLHVLLNEIKKDTIQIPKFALDLHPKSLVRKVGIFLSWLFLFFVLFFFFQTVCQDHLGLTVLVPVVTVLVGNRVTSIQDIVYQAVLRDMPGTIVRQVGVDMKFKKCSVSAAL